MNTWTEGDLLVVTRSHLIEKGSMEKEWPEVWGSEKYEPQSRPTKTIKEGEVVLAMDSGEVGQKLVVRVLFDSGVWVIGAQCVRPIKQTENI